MTDPIRLTVNGQQVEASDPDLPLVLYLRNDLDLKGVRAGCSQGFCGSCTVLCDGEPLKSCITPTGDVADRTVTTPEGLGTPAQPHPVQQAFLDEQAAQCGYCINGFVMRVAAAAADDRVPSDEEFDEDHRCRCGTHPRIRRAAERARAAAAGGRDAAGVGTAVPEAELPLLAPLSRDVDRVEAWLQLLPDGRVAALTGKVELGQGIRTALAQIVASQLGVRSEVVLAVPTTTALSADEKYTAGSNSVDTGGAALGRAAVAFRRHLLACAARLLDVAADELEVDPSGSVRAGGRSVPFADLAVTGPVVGEIGAGEVMDWRKLGEMPAVPRADLPAKLTGAPAFIHDLVLPDMVHARALLPPSYDARLVSLDVDAARALPGVLDIVVDGRLVIAIAEREEQAIRAVARLARDVRWETPELGTDALGLTAHLRTLDGEPHVASETGKQRPTPSLQATYTVPYQAHAAIAPSCGLATEVDGSLEVFSHSQGVYPLRDSIADLVGLAADQVTVAHRDGPGCYGHNLADDAAAFAALAARAVPGRAVRFQFSMEDEFTWEPYGPAMVLDLAATLDGARIAHWDHHGITGMHSTRPRGVADHLAPSWLRSDARPRPAARPFEGGTRNAVPIYDLPAVDAIADHVDGPLRTGSLRTLGAFANSFAAECFLDEVAELAGQDPVAFRLAHLGDERARAVLTAATDAAGWTPRVGPSGAGRGVALSRYKDQKAYVAAVADVEVDPETAVIRVTRLLLACDAGVVVNRDGLVNQLEGGALQALSRLLYEAVEFDRHQVTSRDWSTYPTLGFGDLPDLEVVVVDSDAPPLGAGEASLGPAAAAVANAVDDRIGVRLRSLPFTPKQLTERLYALEGAEAERVLLG